MTDQNRPNEYIRLALNRLDQMWVHIQSLANALGTPQEGVTFDDVLNYRSLLFGDKNSNGRRFSLHRLWREDASRMELACELQFPVSRLNCRPTVGVIYFPTDEHWHSVIACSPVFGREACEPVLDVYWKAFPNPRPRIVGNKDGMIELTEDEAFTAIRTFIGHT